MNKDMVRDYNYLALELTKTMYNNDRIGYNKTDIMETFNYYLLKLTDLNEEIDTKVALKEENETLKLAIEKIKEDLSNNSVVDKKKERLIVYINECKGDMEPYVVDGLINIINDK